MRLIEYWMEKTAGWKKKFIEGRLAATKFMPSPQELGSIMRKADPNSSMTGKEFTSLVDRRKELRGRIKGYLRSLGEPGSVNSRESLQREVLEHRRELRKTNQMINEVKEKFILDKRQSPEEAELRRLFGGRSRNYVEKSNNTPVERYGSLGSYFFDRYQKANSLSISPDSIPKHFPTIGEFKKNNPELFKDFFPLSQLHKRMSRDLGFKVSPRDLTYRSGRLNIPGNETFVSKMPEVAAGYGQGQIGQFNVALTKDLGVHFYTPHLATVAESLAPGLKGQNRRVISALHNSREGREKFHSRLNQERFPKNWQPGIVEGKPTWQSKGFHHSGNDEWYGTNSPQYEATIKPAVFSNAPSLKSYVAVPTHNAFNHVGEKVKNLSNQAVLNKTLLGTRENVQNMVDNYNSYGANSFFKSTGINKYLNQFKGNVYGENKNKFLPSNLYHNISKNFLTAPKTFG